MALHCPATLLVAPRPGEEGSVRPLREQVRGEQVSAVVTSPDDPHGAELADLLGVPHEVDEGLAAAPDRDALLGVADLHRGETVVVLTGTLRSGEAHVVRKELGDA